jgi:cold shock CspA family protein
VNPKHGYGFIETPGGDVFFHKSGVRAEAFEALAIGTRVAFVFAVGERGCQANDVAALPSA